jgi:hypothetical protein
MLPDNFSFFGTQAIHQTIAGANIDFVVHYDWTRPEAASLLEISAQAAIRLELPNRLSVCLAKTIDVAVFRGRIDKAVRHGRG